ncbi:MAG TPA: glycosyltransferase 87 family protein [Chloroflexota bacterium]
MNRTGRRLALALCAVLVLANLALGLLAAQDRTARMRLTEDAAYSDLYSRWRGTRELLLKGENPYTPAATEANERGQYGRLLGDNRWEVDATGGYMGFTYPLYFALLIAPLALLPFSIVKPLATLLIAAVLFWAALGAAEAAGWLAGRRRPLVGLLFLASFPAVDLVTLQQPSGLTLGLVALAALALRRRRLAIAGAALAVATFKPSLVALACLGLVLWAARDPRRRWRLPAALAATLAVMCALTLAMVPTWPLWFLEQLRTYALVNWLASPIDLLPEGGWRVAVGAAMVLINLALFAWPRAGAGSEDSPPFGALALSFATTLILVPTPSSYDRCFLIFAAAALGAAGAAGRPGFAGLATRLALVYLGVVMAAGTLVAAVALLAGGAAPAVATGGAMLFKALLFLLPLMVWVALTATLLQGISVGRGWRPRRGRRPGGDLPKGASQTRTLFPLPRLTASTQTGAHD